VKTATLHRRFDSPTTAVQENGTGTKAKPPGFSIFVGGFAVPGQKVT
jgi:hypothetical protein